jgi:predicted DNA-binding ribbon-helix-helix protein
LDQGEESGRASCDEVDRRMNSERVARPPAKSLVVKQSVNVNGRYTSVSLEDAFWNPLKEIAAGQNINTIPLF